MNPIQASDAIAALSLALALVVFLVSQRKDGRAAAARDQLLYDKLDSNNEMARETRDTVREMSRKLDDHGQLLARHTEQIQALSDRVDRIEHNCDLHARIGGTD